MTTKIVILGGGTGGLVVANKLRSKLSSDNEIIIIDKEENHIFYPSLLWVMVGWRSGGQIQKPYSALERKGMTYINAEVLRINYDNRIVQTTKGEIAFDFLVISLGASMFPERLPGFSEAAYNLYDINGVERIREELENFSSGKIVILVSSKPFKCPAAPYEAALLISSFLTKKKKKAEIEIVTPEQLPMGVAGPEVGNMVVSLVKSRGVRFTPEHQAREIKRENNSIVFQEGKTIAYDLLIGIPPHSLPEALIDSPILGETGWVKVSSKTLATKLDNIYAIGDITGITLPSGKPLPKAGVFAHFQADTVAHNIVSKIKKMDDIKEFDGRGSCFIELGDGRAGYASGNFYAVPNPVVKLKKPSRLWHWGKVLFEKWWFRKFL